MSLCTRFIIVELSIKISRVEICVLTWTKFLLGFLRLKVKQFIHLYSFLINLVSIFHISITTFTWIQIRREFLILLILFSSNYLKWTAKRGRTWALSKTTISFATFPSIFPVIGYASLNFFLSTIIWYFKDKEYHKKLKQNRT